MKYLKLNIQLLFAFVIVLGLFSCTDEDVVDNGKKEIKEGLPTTVSLKLTSATPMVVETKTADEGGKFGVINDLAILVYKTETGELDKVTYVSNVNAKEWDGTFNATTGERRVYVLANSGLGENAIKNAYNQESNLLNAELISAETVPEGNEQMLGFVRSNSGDFKEVLSIDDKSESITIPESNGETSVITLYSHLYPPYSKITFTVKNEVKTDMSEKVQLNITNVYVRNLPRKYSLLPVKNILKTSGTEDNDDVFSGKVEQVNQGEDVYEFYMYENLQGTRHEENKDPKLKSPFEDKELPSENFDYNIAWDTKWATQTPCTYIEVEGDYAIWKSAEKLGAGKIHYRFFLGENTYNNFDITRNTHYKVELVFTGDAGYGELGYEWRVYAELDDVIVIPEGELVIDGACDAKFPFYIINTTEGTLQFKLQENIDYSDLKFDYKDLHGYEQKGHSKPEVSLLPKKESQGLYEFKVYPTNIGVIGSAGHSLYYGAAPYDCYKYGGTEDFGTGKINDIKLNFTLREDVAAGLIFRKRTVLVSGSVSKTLIIREYPLLFLGDNDSDCDINSSKAIYAQRVDMGFASSQVEANNICSGSGTVGSYLHYQLPTSDNLLKIKEYEVKFPLKVGKQYWTENGLWSPNGVVDSSQGGYVRCVYRK